MNTKGIKFLAVLAVLAMAFAAFAVASPTDADTDAKDILAFDETVDFSLYYNKAAGTTGYTTSNAVLGNVIEVKTTWDDNTAKNYHIYTINGYVKNQGTLTDGIAKTLGMGDNNAMLAFNMDILEDAIVFTSADGTTWTKVSNRMAMDTTTEPCLFNVTNNYVKFIGYAPAAASGADEPTAPTVYAKIVIPALDANKAFVAGSDDTTVISSSTTDVTTAYAIVASDVTINAEASTGDLFGLKLTGTSNAVKLFIAPGKKLTINISGEIAKANNGYGLYAPSATDIIGLGSAKTKVVINDTTTRVSDWTGGSNKGSFTTIALGHSNDSVTYALTLLNVDLDINQADAACGFGMRMKAGVITFDSSKATIDSSNRALNVEGKLIVKNNSDVTFNGGEAGIKGTMTNGIEVGTDDSTSDKSSLKAGLFNPAQYNTGNNDRYGIRVEGAGLTIYKSSTVKTDSLFGRAADIKVSGTLNVTGTTLAGYYDTVQGEVNGTWVPSGLVVAGTVNSNGKITALEGKAIIIASTGTVTVAKGSYVLGTIKDAASATGTAVFGVIDTDSTNTTATYYASAVKVTSDATFTHGSVVMKGSFTKDEVTGVITITGKAEISGVLDTAIVIGAAGAELLVPAGESLKFDSGSAITASTYTTKITVLGDVSGTVQVTGTAVTVEAANPDAASAVIKGQDIDPVSKIAVIKLTGNDTDVADLKYLVDKYQYIGIQKNASATLNVSSDVSIPKNVVVYLGVAVKEGAAATLIAGTTAAYEVNLSGIESKDVVTIDVKAGKDFAVTSAKIYDQSTDMTSKISVSGNLLLDAADVCAIVSVPALSDGYVSVKNPLSLNATGTLTSDLMVGYGNVLTMNGVTVPNGKEVYAYGTLNIDGNNTVAYGGKVITYSGATANINGNFTVEGTVETAGSTNVYGTATVYRSAGSAAWTNSGFIYVASDAVFNVTKATQLDANANTFTNVTDNVNKIYGSLYLYGTSTITGTFVGDIVDYGTLTFNGTSGGATVYLRNGVSMELVSVTGSNLVVSDSNAAYDDTHDDNYNWKAYVMVYDGNSFTFNNAKGLIITETVKESAGTVGTDKKDVKYYVSTLTVTGTSSSAVKETVHYIDVAGGEPTHMSYVTTWPSTAPKGSAEIGDLTVGKKGELAFTGSNRITVPGMITVVAEDARVQFENTGAVVYVTGTIYANDDKGFKLSPSNYTAVMTSGNVDIQGFAGKVNATFCQTDDDDGDTDYYLTAFETALPNILTVDDDTLFIYGTQEIATELEIPAEGTVIIQADSTMKVKDKGVVTIAKGAMLDGYSGKIDVAGILVVTDKDTGLKYSTSASNFVYQVKTENGSTVTYSGIAGALKRAVSGDVIEMSQSGELSSDATIPEGVTLIVPSKIKLTVGSTSKEITLTVDGQLKVLKGGEVAVKSADKAVTIVTNGSILVDASDSTKWGSFDMDNYVMFAMKVDGRTNKVYSNLTFAAENCTDGIVTVHGSVSAGVIAFTPAKDKEIVIVISGSNSASKLNAMAVVSLALNNKTTIYVDAEGTNAGVFSGTILAPSVDGVATIEFDDATGFLFQANMVETADGDVYHAILDTYEADETEIIDNGFDGSIEILSGTVEVDAYTIGVTGVTLTEDSPWIINQMKTSASLYVGPEAALVIATGAYLYILDSGNENYDDPMAVFEGTLLINGEMGVAGYTVVDGLMTVVKERSVESAIVALVAGGVMDLDGDLVISDDKTLGGSFGVLLGSHMNVGEDASVTGPLYVDESSYINVFAGADVEEAMLNWDVATQSSKAIYTDVYVFGVPYVTTYTNADAHIDLIGSAITADTEIIGCDVAGSYNAKDPATSPTYYLYWFTDLAAEQNLKIGKEDIGIYNEVYFNPAAAKVYGKVTVGVGITLYVDGKIYDKTTISSTDYLTVGTHTVSVQISSLYDGDNVTIKFNDKVVPVTAAGGTIIVTADMTTFTLVADGAAPYVPPEPEPTPTPEAQSEWTVTTILLCVLVVLIAIMAVIVALRLNRN